MSRLSVRARMAAVAALLSTIVLLAASVFMVRIVENDVRDQTNTALRNALREQAAEGRTPGALQTHFDVVVGGRRYQLSLFDELSEGNAGGNLFADDKHVAELEIDLRSSDVISATDPTTGTLVTDETTISDLEALTFEVIESGAEDGSRFIVGAASTDQIDEATGAVRRGLYAVVPLLVVLSAIMAWLLAGRSLRPVAAISKQASSISLGDIDQRVPVPSGNDEISHLANILNEMLGRLEDGSRSQQRFAADASHELRTPLSTVRVLAESIEQNPENGRTGERAAGIIKQADRMDRLTGDMLLLASPSGKPSMAPFDLTALLDELISELTTDDSPAITFDSPRSGPVAVVGHQGLIQRALANVLSNAKRYAASKIAIQVATDDAATHITISDDGPGVDPSNERRIFDQFVRLDPARSRDTGGSGLGLAITASVVEAHGGSVMTQPSPELGGAQFVLSFPLDQAKVGTT